MKASIYASMYTMMLDKCAIHVTNSARHQSRASRCKMLPERDGRAAGEKKEEMKREGLQGDAGEELPALLLHSACTQNPHDSPPLRLPPLGTRYVLPVVPRHPLSPNTRDSSVRRNASFKSLAASGFFVLSVAWETLTLSRIKYVVSNQSSTRSNFVQHSLTGNATMLVLNTFEFNYFQLTFFYCVRFFCQDKYLPFCDSRF